MNYTPRIPRQTWSERHAVLMLGLALLAFWALTIGAIFVWVLRK